MQYDFYYIINEQKASNNNTDIKWIFIFVDNVLFPSCYQVNPLYTNGFTLLWFDTINLGGSIVYI